jgi:hypothetical protein
LAIPRNSHRNWVTNSPENHPKVEGQNFHLQSKVLASKTLLWNCEMMFWTERHEKLNKIADVQQFFLHKFSTLYLSVFCFNFTQLYRLEYVLSVGTIGDCGGEVFVGFLGLLSLSFCEGL